MAETPPAVYTLHYFPFSPYSLMARFGFVLAHKLDPAVAPRLRVRLVNLHREDHISEPYLTLVNTKGQVPSLTSPALPAALDDSRAIADWLCQQQPELLPEHHRDTVLRLMNKMYSFHETSLTTSPAARPYGIPNVAAARLERNNLPPRYRRALEVKSLIHDSTHGSSLEPDSIALAEELAADLMSDLADVHDQHSQGRTWLFGNKPSILDAYATPLLARLLEAERHDLVPAQLQDYARRIIATPEWEEVTHGRPTLWNASLGEVADLDEI